MEPQADTERKREGEDKPVSDILHGTYIGHPGGYFRDGDHCYVVCRPFAYIDLKGYIHVVYPGHVSDGRSGKIGYYTIGPAFRSRYLFPALVHDFYCAKAKQHPAIKYQLAREACDRLFREGVEGRGAYEATEWAMYRAVRAHAWKHRNNVSVAFDPSDWLTAEYATLGRSFAWEAPHVATSEGINLLEWVRTSQLEPIPAEVCRAVDSWNGAL